MIRVHFYRPSGPFGWLVSRWLKSDFCHVSVQIDDAISDISVMQPDAGWYRADAHLEWRPPAVSLCCVTRNPPEILPTRRRMGIWENIVFYTPWLWPFFDADQPFNCVKLATDILRWNGVPVPKWSATPDQLFRSICAICPNP